MQTRLFVFLTASVLAPGQDLERTFPLNYNATPQDLQEVLTMIRAIADVKQVDANAEGSSIAIHGSSDQIALTEWLLTTLHAPAGSVSSEKRKYQMPAGKDDAPVVAAFNLAHAGTVRNLQEVATVVRSIGEIRRLFVYTAREAIAVRGTRAQIDLAERLVNELDRPVDTLPSAGRREYTTPGPGFPDNVVRVFSLKPETTMQRLQEIALQVRVTTGVRRLFTYNAARAITLLKGTPSQVEQAYQMIAERDR